MFPARVGMNRPPSLPRCSGQHVPRACGDEPPTVLAVVERVYMFPARVGMNRTRRRRNPAHPVLPPPRVEVKRDFHVNEIVQAD